MTQQVETIQYDYVAKDELSAPTLALIKILELLTHHQLSSLLAHAVKLSALSELQKKT